MNKEELKTKILEANISYRSGNSIMSDNDYDNLVDEFRNQFPDEYDSFRDSLNEGSIEYGAKVKHPFVMGSLNKLTLEKPNDIFKFIKKNITTCINVSAKVDGISCRLHYSNGKLVQASTRGDGEEGTDITNKINYVKHVPSSISLNCEIDIRGELVIFNSDFSKLSGFANPRNATAGIINRKDWNESDVSNVSFVAYTILGPKYPKDEQFYLLKQNSFYVAWYDNYTSAFYSKPEFIDKLYEAITKKHDYNTDGLVVTDSTYHNEEKYRPDACVAIKGNLEFATSKILDVEWRGPSANGKFVPVAQLEPVELCGTTVSQATMNNLDFIEKMNLRYGSVVTIQKRGEIIPSLISVVSNDNTSEIEKPAECPCCGSKLVKDGPFLWCKNKDCSDQMLKRVVQFIKALDVKHSSEASLKNFGINTFEDLIKFIPDKKYKSEVKLYDELNSKVFTRSKNELFAATPFKDLSEILINKIVDFYGFDNIENNVYNGLPDGIGEITLTKFKENAKSNLDIVKSFMSDSRYSRIETVSETTKSNGMSVCFTGKLNTMSRNEAAEIAKKVGFEVLNGVNKKLTYLVTNDTESGSSKNRKAKEFGTKIISEDEFLKMTNSMTVESDVFAL